MTAVLLDGIVSGELTAEQWIFLGMTGSFFVIILLLWNSPFLFPWKLFTVLLHELSHALAGVLTCAKIKGIEVNLDEGGVTHMEGGRRSITLPAGYLGSAVWGAIMIILSFSRVLSVWASLFLILAVLISMWWAKKNLVALTVSVIFLCILLGLLALCFTGVDERALGVRLYLSFVGVMSCMFSTFDIYDDTIRRRVNESDASQCAQMTPCTPRCWGVIWFFISLIFFLGAVICGLLVNEGLDERDVDPTPWTGDVDNDPVVGKLPLDLFLIVVIVPSIAVVLIAISIILWIVKCKK
ncbi:Peptidase m50B-like domain-containing [Balamuthia mandrillaris]